VETDKATMELESYEDGTLLYIGVGEGESVEVDGVLAIVGAKDADYKTLLTSAAQPALVPEPEVPAAPAPAASASAGQSTSAIGEGSPDRVKASPLARKMAQDKGFDITQIKGVL